MLVKDSAALRREKELKDRSSALEKEVMTLRQENSKKNPRLAYCIRSRSLLTRS
jgi:hypothetical protein